MLLFTVRILRQLGIPVLLASLLLPVMTCVVPGARMNAQERACCRTMGPGCGQPGTGMTHSCCKETLPGLHNQALETRSVAVCPLTFAVIHLGVWGPADPSSSVNGRIGYADNSLSGSPPTSVSILRI
jgi:hypothetical protein